MQWRTQQCLFEGWMWEICQAVWKGPVAVRWHANNPSEIALSLPCHPCNRLIPGWGGGEAGLEWRLQGQGRSERAAHMGGHVHHSVPHSGPP